MKSIAVNKKNSQSGAASIVAIVLFALLVLVLALQFSSAILSENFATSGSSKGAEALAFAEAGAKDALLRIARNKTYVCSGTDCYSIDMAQNGCSLGTACAKISVSSGIGSAGDPKIITSKGFSEDSVRKIRVTVVFDAGLDGEIQSAVWQELTD